MPNVVKEGVIDWAAKTGQARKHQEVKTGEVITTSFWCVKDRTQNLYNAIKSMIGGAEMISAKEVARIFGVTQKDLARIPNDQLFPIREKGGRQTFYFALEVAQYCAKHPTCKILQFNRSR